MAAGIGAGRGCPWRVWSDETSQRGTGASSELGPYKQRRTQVPLPRSQRRRLTGGACCRLKRPLPLPGVGPQGSRLEAALQVRGRSGCALKDRAQQPLLSDASRQRAAPCSQRRRGRPEILSGRRPTDTQADTQCAGTRQIRTRAVALLQRQREVATAGEMAAAAAAEAETTVAPRCWAKEANSCPAAC